MKFKLVESVEADLVENSLSPEQKSFFKNSKIRDSKGNLLVCYHASSADFTTFRKDKIGSGNGGANFGSGFYFTPDVNLAKEYGKNIRKFYLNITNPFHYDAVDLKEFQQMINMANMPINHAVYDKVEDEDFWYCDLLDMFVNCLENDPKAYKAFDDVIRKMGYDGILADNEIIAFEPNQIKLTSNLTPSSSDDITEDL